MSESLFQGVAWSTSAVHETMCNKIIEAGLQVAPHLLRTLRDIDTIDDLKAWSDQCSEHALLDVARSILRKTCDSTA